MATKTGDGALRHLADWLTDLVGDDGHVARFGGDEFVVVGTSEPIDRLASSSSSPSAVRRSRCRSPAGWSVGDDLDRALAHADDDLYETKVS